MAAQSLALGTAPRRVGGVWRTSGGRVLTKPGQSYWENLYRTGRTDGMGHMRSAYRPEPATPSLEPASPAPSEPSFETALAAARGDQQARQQVRAYGLHQQAQRTAEQQTQNLQDLALFGQATPTVYRAAARTRLNPVAAGVINALSPVDAARSTYSEAKRGHLGAAGLSALGVLPFGKPVRALRAAEDAVTAARTAKVAEAGLSGRRALVAGEKAQQLPQARSRLTRALIEKPADVLSQRYPGVPIVGAEARVAKHAGRAQLLESGRERTAAQAQVRALPKKGSPADVAHFWWAQLPASLRNAGGLQAVRDAQLAELGHLTSPERVTQLQQRGAKIKLAGLPEQARVLGASVNRLDKIIANPPKLEPKVIEAVHALSGDRQAVLTQAGLLTPERAQARSGLVANWLGRAPTGEEAFIGHRLDLPTGIRGSRGLRSIGLGKPQLPKGISRANKLVLAKTGALHQSTHVAAADWAASHTYREALRARADLAAMGKPFEGYLPDKHMLVNPEGKTVPQGWKTDMLARSSAEHPEAVRPQVEQLMHGFLGDHTNWEDIVNTAKQTGSFDKLRVVPESTVSRYYSQFLPVGRPTRGGRLYDHLIDSTAASLIFARLGYIPKNVLQNLVMAVPHQGPLLLANAPRAAQLIPHPGQPELDSKLWHLLSHEVGGGASGAIRQETTATKVIGKPAQVVTNIADSPLRISAFLHEAAAEGVIPRLSPHLSEGDKQALYDLLTSPAKRPQLNDVAARAKDAMGDFNRLTPTQRRWARRFLIVPGWLGAGTRYPFHFAATHPLRTAALAWAGAGEPGAPKRLQVNKPLDEYLVKGLPPYLQALSAEHWPGWLGGGKGKIERIQSLFPASLPVDMALAAKQGNPVTAASYANPLPVSVWNTAQSSYQTASGQVKQTSFLGALKRNLQRLAPGESFLQSEVSPSHNPSSLYADQSRWGSLGREFGVVPVAVNRDNALRSSLNARGMTKSVLVLSDKTKLLQQIKTAGEQPSQALLDAYSLRLERAQVLDGIHAHGLTYQQQAYKADVALLLKHGRITKQEATATLRAAASLDERTLKAWRGWLTANKFDGQTIRDVKQYLAQK